MQISYKKQYLQIADENERIIFGKQLLDQIP